MASHRSGPERLLLLWEGRQPALLGARGQVAEAGHWARDQEERRREGPQGRDSQRRRNRERGSPPHPPKGGKKEGREAKGSVRSWRNV